MREPEGWSPGIKGGVRCIAIYVHPTKYLTMRT